MDLAPYFRSIIEQDRCAVVICNLEHEIIYMNPTAIERYAKAALRWWDRAFLPATARSPMKRSDR